MYPEKNSLNAFTTLFGVSLKPSRDGSSPAHFMSVSTAFSASSLEIDLSKVARKFFLVITDVINNLILI